MSSSIFHPVIVHSLHRLTEDALTITLKVPENKMLLFSSAIPGQFIVVKVSINGEEYRRSYSINSAMTLGEPLQITIKRLPDGIVSSYLHNSLKKGDTITVSTPGGNFVTPINPKQQKSYYFFAAGSGITPVISMIKTILHAEPWSNTYLLYGNRNEKQIIFYDELSQLQKQYPERFIVRYLMSDPLSKKWSALWKSIPKVSAEKGRINKEAVTDFLDTFLPKSQSAGYYLCGPEQMITDIAQHLTSFHIHAEDIHREYFAGKGRTEKRHTGHESQITITGNVNKQTISTHKGETLLDSLLREKVEVNYSCQSGVCGSCCAQLNQGTVAMENIMGLTEQEIKQNRILLCQCYPTSDKLSISI